MDEIETVYTQIDNILRKASISKIGGFKPPEDKITSWFGGAGVGLAGEVCPKYNGQDMFCLLQIKVSELPFIPIELENIAFLVVFFNRQEIPFDCPHGDGWLIREYESLEGLQLLPKSEEREVVINFPIKWLLVEDDAPSWDTAWDFVDLSVINEIENASDRFFFDYNRYTNTKVGGFPCEIQHGEELEGYVFQIGSEEKPNWMWADNGIAYFKKINNVWSFSCQIY